MCDRNEVGDRVEIIRVIENGRTKVFEDVVHSGREALELAAAAFALVFSVMLLLSWLSFGLRRWRLSRVRSR